MRKSEFTEAQIIAILNEADAGVAIKDICRKHGISPSTDHKWKSKYVGLSVPVTIGSRIAMRAASRLVSGAGDRHPEWAHTSSGSNSHSGVTEHP